MSACVRDIVSKKPDAAWRLGLALTLFSSVLYPRFLLLGCFPGMDEGYYAWQTMHIHAFLSSGHGLPPDGAIGLYPLLLSCLAYLPGSLLIWLRLADLLCALAAGWLFILFLRALAHNNKIALLLGFIFLCAMNLEPVIDGGYKNSIFMAYIPLFLAMNLTLEQRTDPPWAGIGALTAAAVLFREPLALFAFLGFGAIWTGWNFRAAFRYALGGAVTGLGVFLLIGLARGDALSPFTAYLNAGGVYAVQTRQVLTNFLNNGQRALLYFSGPLLVALYGCFFLKGLPHASLDKNAHQPSSRQLLFWLGAAFLPLLEPALKIGFLYHFAQCLPGLAGLSALFWRNFSFGLTTWRQLAGSIILASAALQAILSFPSPMRMEQAISVLKNIDSNHWQSREELSNTLLAAKAIESASPTGTLASSGFTYFLYGVTGKLPPQLGKFDPADNYRLADLARSYRAMGMNPDRLANALRQNPPDVIAVGYAVEEHEPDFFPGVLEGVRKSGLYEEIAVVEPDRRKNYGWLGYIIFRKVKQYQPESKK